MIPGALLAMEPPRPGELKEYAKDGSLQKRIDAGLQYGNHLTSPRLIWNLQQKLLKAAGKTDAEVASRTVFAPPPAWQGGLPSLGTVKTFVLLVDFPDYPHSSIHTQADVASKFFGDGDSSRMPYESLRNFYLRSSYSQLTIQGTVFDWYRAQNNRSYYEGLGNGPGQEALMKEALNYWNVQGHDFTQYDNDNDGTIDAFFLKWTGADNGWANFWWAYQWVWHSNPTYTIDGKALGNYVWSWISNPTTAYYQALVDIHETGHLLGLPDLYDYDDTVGPDGGVGGLDMMDYNWGDHNCFSKYMLDWLTPTSVTSGSLTKTFNPSGTSQDCVQIMPNLASGTLFGEFFMAQYRKRSTGNDPSNYPTDGLLIWHVDSTLTSSGQNFLWDNSYTAHKYVRLMEADGLEEIEQNLSANAGDFYVPGKTFGDTTTPNSQAYSGVSTTVRVDQLTTPGTTMTGRFGFLSTPQIAGTSSLVSEDCQPASGAIDPLENVTLNIQLQNTGLTDATNLVATLQATGGVVQPSGPQPYGALQAGGAAVTRSFSFLATGTCSGTLTATLQLQDGTTNLGTLAFTYMLGSPHTALSQNFDAVTAPALPAGWTATVGQGSVAAWATSTAARDTVANAAFATDPTTLGDNYLVSPTIAIATASAWLTFRHQYTLETNFDGGVLEIAIGSGSFTDIVTAGGSFSTGGYAATISTSYGSLIAGRAAWSGSSGGFITTTVTLPATAAGQNVRLRWRLASDTSVGAAGWYVDTIVLVDGVLCCQGIPGDMDGDNDVDQSDYGLFQACYSESGASQTDPACARAKLDAGDVVDLSDLLIFQGCMSGPGIPGRPDCKP